MILECLPRPCSNSGCADTVPVVRCGRSRVGGSSPSPGGACLHSLPPDSVRSIPPPDTVTGRHDAVRKYRTTEVWNILYEKH